jgi:hypothetical protein
MADVKAMARECNATVTSDGSDNTMVFDGHDALGDGEGWIDCRSFLFCSAYANVDAAGCSFTINGKVTQDAPTVEVQAQAAQASDGFIATALDIKAYSYLQFKEQGTNTQTNALHVVLK